MSFASDIYWLDEELRRIQSSIMNAETPQKKSAQVMGYAV